MRIEGATGAEGNRGVIPHEVGVVVVPSVFELLTGDDRDKTSLRNIR